MSLIFPQPGNVFPIYVGTWAGRPTAAADNAGSVIQVTDYGTGGRSYWWSDGSNWRPMNGTVELYSLIGSKASPIATLAGNGTNQAFTLPSTLTLPAGMRWPGMRVRAEYVIARTVLAGAPVTLNSVSVRMSTVPTGVGGIGASIASYTRNANTDTQWLMSEATYIGANAFSFYGYMPCDASGSATANFADVSGVFLDNADVYFRVQCDPNLLAGDTLALYRVNIGLIG